MTGEELRAAAVEIWGERVWVSSLASALGLERTQVWRYANAKTPVPSTVGALVTLWLARVREGYPPPTPLPVLPKNVRKARPRPSV